MSGNTHSDRARATASCKRPTVNSRRDAGNSVAPVQWYLLVPRTDGGMMQLQLGHNAPRIVLEDEIAIDSAEARRLCQATVGKDVLGAQQRDVRRLAVHLHVETSLRIHHVEQLEKLLAFGAKCAGPNRIDDARLPDITSGAQQGW